MKQIVYLFCFYSEIHSKQVLPPVSLQANKLQLLVKRKKINQALRSFRVQQKCPEIEFLLSNETQCIVVGKLGHLVPKLSLSLILPACLKPCEEMNCQNPSSGIFTANGALQLHCIKYKQHDLSYHPKFSNDTYEGTVHLS